MMIMTELFPHADSADQIEQRIAVHDIEDESSTELSIPIDSDPTDYREQHQVIWSAIDDPEPLRPESMGRGPVANLGLPSAVNTMSNNKLLLVTNIYPAGHQIRIEDLGTCESPDMQRPGTAELDIGEHVLFVYTMTADEADAADSTVTIRIYAGADNQTLGKRIYNGTITLTRPELAIGDALDPPEAMLRVPLQRAGVTNVQVFTRRTIENVSGPDEISLLLPEEVVRTVR